MPSYQPDEQCQHDRAERHGQAGSNRELAVQYCHDYQSAEAPEARPLHVAHLAFDPPEGHSVTLFGRPIRLSRCRMTRIVQDMRPISAWTTAAVSPGLASRRVSEVTGIV